MNAEYEKEYIVKYHDCSSNDIIDFGVLIRYMQETSTLHAGELGCGIEYLNKNKLGWVLIENHCNVIKYPKINEKIKVKTWVNKMEKLYAIRQYQILDTNDNIVLESYTKWILYSFDRLRPIKISQEICDMFEYIDKTTIKIENIDFESECIQKKELNNSIVLYQDVDTNWHMNNVSYINETLETMGKEFLDNNEIVQCFVEYRQQLLYNTPFCIEKVKISDDEYIYSIRKIQKDEEKVQKGNNANIYLKWRKKSESYNKKNS